MSEAPRRHRRWPIWLAALAAVVAVFTYRFVTMGGVQAPPSISSVHAIEGKPVETAAAAPGDLAVWTTLAGTIKGVQQSPLVSQVSLPVVEIAAPEGSMVQAGDVIIRLVREAPSPMYHSYERSLASYHEAEREADRLRNLFAAGAVSRQTLDQAETRLRVAAEDLRDARSGTELAAPHAGMVTSLLVEEGETVKSGQPVGYIAQIDSVRVAFEAGSRQAALLRRGQPARWFSPDSTVSRTGRIVELDLAADPRTHLLAGEAVFPNPDGALLPGLLVTIEVETGQRTGVLLVPATAVAAHDSRPSVFAVEARPDGDRAVARPVELGLRTTDAVEVRSGLAAGEIVVVHGQRQLATDDLVKVVAGPRPAGARGEAR